MLSEYGYWGEELIGPTETLEKAGYILDYATPTGKRPPALPPSMDASYADSPLGKPDFEAYNKNIEAAAKLCECYVALVLAGGSGPIVDMVNNVRVHDLIQIFYHADKPIAAEGYGVACLAFARDYWLRKNLIWGKHVTGHPLEYDYLDGTGFFGVEFNMGSPPYPLEFILRDAVGPDGMFHGNVGKTISAIVGIRAAGWFETIWVVNRRYIWTKY